MTKKSYTSMFAGMFLAFGLVGLLSAIVIPKIIQAVFITNHSMSFITDINEYSQILNDYKNDIVPNEYTNTLLTRKIDSLTVENDTFLEVFSDVKRINVYHEAVSEMIQKLDEIRIRIENQELPADESFLSEIQFDLSIEKYREAVTNGISFW